MKITQKDINYFNNFKGVFDAPSFNEEYNKANGIPSREVFNFMCRVSKDEFGLFSNAFSSKLTLKMCKGA